MVLDKYSAVWISHSSISDFIACPKAYFYANVYKNPRSGKKITIEAPYPEDFQKALKNLI